MREKERELTCENARLGEKGCRSVLVLVHDFYVVVREVIILPIDIYIRVEVFVCSLWGRGLSAGARRRLGPAQRNVVFSSRYEYVVS